MLVMFVQTRVLAGTRLYGSAEIDSAEPLDFAFSRTAASTSSLK
jgi:hypothetical protein